MNKRYALCVGNNYPGTNAQLSGCVNDAWDWSLVLAEGGYDVEVRVEATLKDTLEALTELVAKTGFGDRIVFTYSGHGTWLPDRDGDEADGRDEALVMADYVQGGLLVDDTLQEIFGHLKYGAGALILSDSCHSGTVSRLIPSISTGSDVRPKIRFLSPTNFMDISADQARALERVPASLPRRTASLVSGCEDQEYSYDAWFSGRANGAFTRTAIDAYQPGVKLGAWHKRIRERLPRQAYPQSPALTAATAYRKYSRAI